MPINFNYDKDKDVLLITLEGEVSVKDVANLYGEIVTASEFPPDIRSIWDLRKLDFDSIDTNFIDRIFSVRKKYPERGNASAAFIADSDLSFGVARMYEVLSSFELPQNIKTFRDYRTAEEWILKEK